MIFSSLRLQNDDLKSYSCSAGFSAPLWRWAKRYYVWAQSVEISSFQRYDAQLFGTHESLAIDDGRKMTGIDVDFCLILLVDV